MVAVAVAIAVVATVVVVAVVAIAVDVAAAVASVVFVADVIAAVVADVVVIAAGKTHIRNHNVGAGIWRVKRQCSKMTRSTKKIFDRLGMPSAPKWVCQRATHA